MPPQRWGCQRFTIVGALLALPHSRVVGQYSLTSEEAIQEMDDSALAAELQSLTHQLAQLRARHCYVQDDVKPVDEWWGMLGRLDIFPQQQLMVQEMKRKVTHDWRDVQAKQRQLAEANCICDTEWPCIGNVTCTNLEPEQAHHYWDGSAWADIVVVRMHRRVAVVFGPCCSCMLCVD